VFVTVEKTTMIRQDRLRANKKEKKK
jgi:hypothetical protein